MSERLEEIKARMAAEAKAKLEAAQIAAEQENPEAAAAAKGDAATGKASGGATISPPHPTPPVPVLPTQAVSITPGEKPVLKTVEELDKNPEAKMRIFRSRIPGSSFVMREGYTIYFTNGWYETTDPSEIAQLDAVANKVPTIHTEEHEKEIIEAILEARRQGFTGSIADAMAQQLTAEQRIQALRTQGGSGGTGAPLKLPTVLPPGAAPAGITQAEAESSEKSLKAAIAASRANMAQSNG